MKKTVSSGLTGLRIATLLIVIFGVVGIPSAYAQVAAIVLQSNGTALQKVGQHLLSSQPTTNGFLGQVGDCSPCGVIGSGDGRVAWVNYIGKQNSLGFNTESILGTALTLESAGVQIGADLFRSKRNQFGVLFDYERFITSDSEADVNILESDNFSGGFYYSQIFANNSDFRGLVKFGSAKNNAIGDTHKVDSDSFNATFEYGKRYFPVQNISLRPYVALDINYAYLGADEIIGIAFRNTKLSQTYFRVGTDLIARIKRVSIKTDISYCVDLVSGRLNVSTNSYGKGWFNDRLHIGRQIASVGLTGQYDFNRRNSVFASFGIDAFFDRDSRPYQSIGTMGYSLVW